MQTPFLLYLQVALGIGAVIFVHELGHFLAARLCGVRVDTFSMGFGPRLLAWRRGPTTYQLALLPLGGYVKMAGEEPSSGDTLPKPDELRAKSVPARFFIYSGGVLMNVVFGLVVFPIALWMGVPFVEPVVGHVQSGGAAWRAGLLPGTRILEVNETPVIGFDMLSQEVALADEGPVRLLVVDPGQSVPREISLQVDYDEAFGARALDIEPPLDPLLRLEIQPDSPAEKAGLRSQDRLVSVHSELPELPLTAQLEIAMRQGQPLELEVERDGVRVRATVEPQATPPAKGRALLGVWPSFRRVRALRPHPLIDALGLLPEDRLLSVAGQPIALEYDFERALTQVPEDGVLRVLVLRHGREVELTAPTESRAQCLEFAREVALDYETESVIAPMHDSAASAAGLLANDRITRVGAAAVASWSELRTCLAEVQTKAVRLTILRGPGPNAVDPALEPQELEITARLAPLAGPSYGVLGFARATYVYRAKDAISAVKIGFTSSWKFLGDSFKTLKRIVLGQVSSDNIGGIITIGAVSYSFASVGFAKLLFFLCMLSMNLAFINVLPIPVLDGGHLFFLLVEGIKGSPVSERVLTYSQVVGLVLLLSLIVFVTYNDLMRWVFS